MGGSGLWNTAGCAAANDGGVDDDGSYDRHATALDTVLISNGAVDQWFSFDITTLVQEWVIGTTKEYGVLLVSDNEGVNGDWIRWHSKEWAVDGTRPYLEINYNP